MMPGIRCERGAFNDAAHAADGAKQSLFRTDSHDQNEKREWRGPVMRQTNFANAFDCERGSSGKNTKGNDDRSQRFRLAMTIRMSGIGRARRISHPAPDNDPPRGVEGRLDSISD